ncbi:3'-5' exonuclease [Calditerrivibrio nitroreducens]|uniref:DNA polymerase III, epsilon subunit n=1 Tax=Calditerrivibrio nitroreducens (strain DSM 19672 / NBRC 101217 / Yu37-1) TaxID=768670 RepID=E4TIH0_CALNY|nr:3'-5' exonuclease [Calditerrivibrio nitroreducens]ADR17995.1 DNA polymerase III, epsilon subunit [Calditerrivibrio nitroreducens DSM 19672]
MQNIVELLDKPLDEVSFVVFDLETTGLNPDNGDQIIEMGAFKIEEGFKLVRDPFHTMVKPDIFIPNEIHGITEMELKNAPDICTALYDFIDFSRGSVLVAHKASKDIAFLRAAMREYLIDDSFDFLVIDTIKFSQRLYPDFKYHNLDYLIEKHHISINSKFKRHRAIYDAEATAKIFLKMIRKIFNEQCYLLSELFEFISK